MFRWLACLLLVVGLPLSSWAEYCPDCGLLLMNKFQSKFERGAMWQLHSCMNHHSYWLQAPGSVAQPDYRYRPPAPTRYDLRCPDCSMFLVTQGSRVNESGRMVTQYRCLNGHVYER